MKTKSFSKRVLISIILFVCGLNLAFFFLSLPPAVKYILHQTIGFSSCLSYLYIFKLFVESRHHVS